MRQPYSSLIASIGATEAARRAGNQDANKATSNSTPVTPIRVRGSPDVISYSDDWSHLPVANAARTPRAAPPDRQGLL